MMIVSNRATFSLSMAIFRVMYIKASHFVKYTIGEIRFAVIMIIFGYLLLAPCLYAWSKNDMSNVSSMNFAQGHSKYQAKLHLKYTGANNESAR